jgi:hypothetical protein
MPTRMRVTKGGWADVLFDDDPSFAAKVRFDAAPTGRLAIAELAIARWPAVTADSLRLIPVGQLEALANAPGRIDELVAAIHDRNAMSKEARDALDEQERGEANTRATWGTSPEAQAAHRQMEKLATPRLRLRIPEGQPKPDDFYRRVALAYSYLAGTTSRPARELADKNDVPASTVHGWVKEARRRKLLAPGERAARGRR